MVCKYVNIEYGKPNILSMFSLYEIWQLSSLCEHFQGGVKDVLKFFI